MFVRLDEVVREDSCECFDAVELAPGRQHINGVFHRIRGNDLAVVAAEKSPVELALKLNANGEFFDVVVVALPEDLRQPYSGLPVGIGCHSPGLRTLVLRGHD
jgi:hypothetical protein